jgi:hypothetical protein
VAEEITHLFMAYIRQGLQILCWSPVFKDNIFQNEGIILIRLFSFACDSASLELTVY